MDFEKTRARLYCASFVMNGLVLPVFVAAVMVLGKATEPVAQLPSDIVRFFAPGLPADLIAAVLSFPVQATILAVVIGAIYWVNCVVKLDDNDQSFQIWNRRLSGSPSMSYRTKVIARIARFWWLLPVLVLLFLILLPRASEPVAVQCEKTDIVAKEEPRCIEMCGSLRFSHHDIAHITVVANRERNETGLHLTKDEIYTARVIESIDWRDGSHEAKPSGVEFGWWHPAKLVEWLRPYPGGDWFQLIGRIDQERYVFPVLDQKNTDEPFVFQAPDDGELVLLVNDVIYTNNRGLLTVEIRPGCPEGTEGAADGQSSTATE